MDSLHEVWQKLEYVTGILEVVQKPDYKTITHKELTDIRDDLNDCAEAVQTIRDRLYQ